MLSNDISTPVKPKQSNFLIFWILLSKVSKGTQMLHISLQYIVCIFIVCICIVCLCILYLNDKSLDTNMQPNCAWQVPWKGAKLRRRAARKLADHKYSSHGLFIMGWMLGTHTTRRDQAFRHWKCNGNGDGCFDALHVWYQCLITLHYAHYIILQVTLHKCRITWQFIGNVTETEMAVSMHCTSSTNI